MMRPGTIAMLALGALLIVAPLALLAGASSSREGTDTRAQRVAKEIDPGFRPWFASPYVPSPATERVLFAVQGLAGAGVIGIYVVSRQRRKRAEGGPHDHR